MDFQAYTLQKHNEWACLQLKAPDSDTRTPIHLCCVIDTSASMSTDFKLENVKRSLQFLLDFLTPQDMISIITFSQAAQTILTPTLVTSLEKDNIRTRISLINVESNTNISGGIIQARSVLMTDTSMKQSILLLTDGVANVGLTKSTDILKLVRNTISGTSMSCVGYGTDHNVDLLQNMATEGSGSYYVVNNLEDVAVVFGDVLGGLISCFAQQIHIILPSGVEVKSRYSMIPLSDKTEVVIGDLSSSMEATFLAKIPTGSVVTVTGYNLQTHTPFEMNTVVQMIDDEEHQVNGEAHYLRFEVLNLIEITNSILKRFNATHDEIKSQLEMVKECITTISNHQVNHAHTLWGLLIQELNTCKSGLENYNNRHHYDMGALMTQRADYLGRMRGIATQEPDMPSTMPSAVPVTRTFSNYVQRQISAQMSATVATPMDPRNVSCDSSPSMVPLPYDMLPIPPIALTRQVACGGGVCGSML
jgi:Mg-chelatase subunit ChlD